MRKPLCASPVRLAAALAVLLRGASSQSAAFRFAVPSVEMVRRTRKGHNTGGPVHGPVLGTDCGGPAAGKAEDVLTSWVAATARDELELVLDAGKAAAEQDLDTDAEGTPAPSMSQTYVGFDQFEAALPPPRTNNQMSILSSARLVTVAVIRSTARERNLHPAHRRALFAAFSRPLVNSPHLLKVQSASESSTCPVRRDFWATGALAVETARMGSCERRCGLRRARACCPNHVGHVPLLALLLAPFNFVPPPPPPPRNAESGLGKGLQRASRRAGSGPSPPA